MVGIITFHGSHNHGSMLQAYALQQTLFSLGYNNEIINFRMNAQKRFYSLYQIGFGWKRFVRSVSLAPFHNERKKRAQKFEKFFSTMYRTSGEELHTYEDMDKISGRYSCVIAGSDQIWSCRVPEFSGSKIDYRNIYFLDFVKKGRKISYASSVGEATIEELKDKAPLLRDFSHISTREEVGAERLNKVLGYPVETVLDPTFLVDKENWLKIAGAQRIVKNNYILLYTLQGYRSVNNWMCYLKAFSKKMGLPIICVAPFFPSRDKSVTNLINVGPEDFINLIANSEVVFTDSFHGTAFSAILNKPFYSYTGRTSNDNRKIEITNKLGLESRVIRQYQDISKITDISLDYSKPNELLYKWRQHSMDYVKTALRDE